MQDAKYGLQSRYAIRVRGAGQMECTEKTVNQHCESPLRIFYQENC